MQKQVAQLVGLILAVAGHHGHHDQHEHDMIHAAAEAVVRIGEDEETLGAEALTQIAA